MDEENKAREFEVKGHKLICPICSHKYFWQRKSLLNTRGMTFMNLDWADKAADNYCCNNCGYVMWFLHPEE